MKHSYNSYMTLVNLIPSHVMPIVLITWLTEISTKLAVN